MKLQIILLLGALSCSLATELNVENIILKKLEADSLLQKKKKNNKQKCGPITDLNPFVPESSMSTDKFIIGSQCSADNKVGVLQEVSEDGYCSGYYQAEKKLPCCCSNKNEARELDFKIPNDAGTDCPLTKLTIKVDETDICNDAGNRMQCCQDCKCFGDPHCKTNVNEKQASDSFVLCDIRDAYSSSSDCGRAVGKKVAKDDKYKARCLGVDKKGNDLPDYSFNKGNCIWVPDSEKYNFSKHGSPCQPKPEYAAKHPMHMKTFKNGVKLSAIVGERGTITKLVLENTGKQFANQPSAMMLDVKRSCMQFCPVDNPDCYQPLGYPDEVEFSNFKLERSDLTSVSHSGIHATDRQWSIAQEGKYGKEVVAQIKCFGGTVTNDQYSFLDSDKRPLYTERTETGDRSTRDNVKTRIDISVLEHFDEQTKSNEGWCDTGKFAEQDAIFGGPDPFAGCEFAQKLDKEDYHFYEVQEKCRELLKANNCDEYFTGENLGGSTQSQENFKKLMARCVEFQCDSFNYDPQPGEESAPPGSDFEVCVSDAFDFGANFVDSVYQAVYTTEGNACKKEIIAKIPGFGDVQVINGLLELDLTEEQAEKLRGEEIVIMQTVCPDDCGHTKSIEATVTLNTLCYDLQNLVSTSGAKLTIDGKPVDLSKYVRHSKQKKIGY